MKKMLLFFSKPIVGGVLSLIGLLEILFSIPSSYITYPIPLWIIVLAIGLVILLPYLWKRLRILYYIRNYTSDSFGGSCLYKWCWARTSDKFNEIIELAINNPDSVVEINTNEKTKSCNCCGKCKVRP